MLGILIGIIGWWLGLLPWHVALVFGMAGVGSILMHLRHLATFHEAADWSKTVDERLVKLERRVRQIRRNRALSTAPIPTMSPFEATPEMYERMSDAVQQTDGCACSPAGQL